MNLNLNQIYQIFDRNVYFLFHYDWIIFKHWPNFYDQMLIQLTNGIHDYNIGNSKQIQISRSFWNIKLPAVLMMIVLFCNVTFLYNQRLIKLPFWMMINFYPSDYDIYAASVVSLWSILAIAQYIYGLSSRLIDYQFLWIIHAERYNPSDYYIRPNDWLRLKKLIKLIFIFVRVATTLVSICTFISFVQKIFVESLFQISAFWSIFWLFLGTMLAFYASSGKIKIQNKIKLKTKPILNFPSHLSCWFNDNFNSILHLLKTTNNND